MLSSRRFFSLILAVVSLVLAPVFSVVTSGYHAVAGWINTSFDHLVLKLVPLKASALGFRPWLPLVLAKAYVQRLVKRETPRMEAGWRMCPSI